MNNEKKQQAINEYQKNIELQNEPFKTKKEIINRLVFINDLINNLNFKLWHIVEEEEQDADEDVQHSEEEEDVTINGKSLEAALDSKLNQHAAFGFNEEGIEDETMHKPL